MKWIISLLMWLVAFIPAHGQDFLQSLSSVDQREANKSFQAALEYTTSGIGTNWHNPDANISGTTVPVKTLQTPTGQECREFTQSISIDFRKQQRHGTACRQADGIWRIVDPTTLKPVIKKAPAVKTKYVYLPPRRYYPYRHYPNYVSINFGYSDYRRHVYFDPLRRGHRAPFWYLNRWRPHNHRH